MDGNKVFVFLRTIMLGIPALMQNNESNRLKCRPGKRHEGYRPLIIGIRHQENVN